LHFGIDSLRGIAALQDTERHERTPRKGVQVR
jgi:hypothetical protein